MSAAVQLIIALLGVAAEITPEIRALIDAWTAETDSTPEELAALDAAVKGDRAKVAEIYRRNGIEA